MRVFLFKNNQTFTLLVGTYRYFFLHFKELNEAMKRILIVGENNACRSQMAEGWMRYYTRNYAEVVSAGLNKTSVDLAAAKSMSAAIIDISKQSSKLIDEIEKDTFDFVIYTFASSATAQKTFNGNPKILIHPFELPVPSANSKETNASYDKLRDEIENFCFDFVHANIRKLY